MSSLYSVLLLYLFCCLVVLSPAHKITVISAGQYYSSIVVGCIEEVVNICSLCQSGFLITTNVDLAYLIVCYVHCDFVLHKH